MFLLLVWLLGAAGPRCSRVGPLLFPFPVSLVVSFSAAASLVSHLRLLWWLPVTPSVCLMFLHLPCFSPLCRSTFSVCTRTRPWRLLCT